MARNSQYTKLKRKRVLIGIIGFLIGIIIGMPVTFLLYSVYINVTTFSFGCAGAALTLLFAEKRKLPTAEEVEKLRFEERLKPLNLSASGPKGTKEGKESKN